MQLIIANGNVIATHDDWQLPNLAALYPGATVAPWGGGAGSVQSVNPATGLPQAVPDPTGFVSALVLTYPAYTPWTDWTVTATPTGPQIATWNAAKGTAVPTNAAVAAAAAALTAAQAAQAQCNLTAAAAIAWLLTSANPAAQALRAYVRASVTQGFNAIIAAGKSGNWSSLQPFTYAQVLAALESAAKAETSPTS
jgi:hypothetical protein